MYTQVIFTAKTFTVILHRINCHIYYDFKQQRFLLRRKPYYISLEIKFEHTTLNVTLFLAPSLSCPEKSTSCSNADGTNVITTITGASGDSQCGGNFFSSYYYYYLQRDNIFRNMPQALFVLPLGIISSFI